MITLLKSKFFVVFFGPFFLGAINVLSFSPYNFTFINFIVFSAILSLILIVKEKTYSKYRKKKSQNYFFLLGCSFGFGFFLFGNYWISISLTHDESFKSLIPIALVLIPLFLSLFFGFTVLIVGPFAEKNISFILFFSLIFSLLEFCRGNILTGFPWNLISYSWSWSNEFIQILSLLGTYAFSLISITIFCVPFIFLQKKINKENFIFLFIILIFITGNYFYGFQKLKNTNYHFDESIAIKVVSPSLSLKNYNTQDEVLQLKELIKISDPDKNRKTLFIWPEGVFHDTFLQDIKKYKSLFIENFSENHLILLGINNFSSNDDFKEKKYFNSLVILDHNLEIVSLYNKLNLVPFGEFLPFKSFLSPFGFKKITRGYNSFTSGKERKILNLDGKFGGKLILPLICYEIIYSGKIKTKKQFPDLAINISEDAWFGNSIGPYQHFSKAIFRSVEEGIFIARSANKGISAFINPNGKVIKSLNTGEKGNIELNFPYFYQTTLFSKFGNKIFFLIIFMYIFLILILKKYKI